MRRSKRGDERQKSEPNYTSKPTWGRNDPSWPADEAPSANLTVYEPYYQSTPRPMLYPTHDHFTTNNSPPFYKNTILCPENIARKEKKSDFTTFLQMFTSFMVDAKNKEDDLNILRNILEPILYNERPSKQIENLAHRLKLVEDTLLNYSVPIEKISTADKMGNDDALRQRVESLEEQVRIITTTSDDRLVQRIQNVEDEISGESSLSERLESLEIIIHGNLIQRLENIEDKCNHLCSSSATIQDKNYQSESQQSTHDSSNVVQRISDIESQVTENGSIPKRIDLLERRIAKLESVPLNSTNSTDTADVVDTSSTKRSESVKRNGKKRKNSKEKEANDSEDKLVPVVQDTMRFIVDKDDYVSVFIDGVGSNCTENSPGIRIWFGEQHPLNVSRPITNDTTNNVAQLMAVQIAIDISTQAGLKKAIIHTSSKFLINSVAKLNIWHSRKWTKKNGQSLKHVDKLKRLRRSLLSISVLLKETNSINEARLLAEVCAKIKKEQE